MDVTRKNNLRRALTEGAVIIFSILLAFWIDASWEKKKEHDDERLLLISLHEELIANQSNLATKAAFHIEMRDAIRTLLSQAVRSTPDLSDVEIDNLLGTSSWFATTTTFEMSAFDAVVSGGSLSVIENRTLRRRITGWRQDVEEVVRIEAQDYDTFSEIWMPYLRENAYMAQINNAIEVQPGSGADDYNSDVPLGHHETSHSKLLHDREFQNILLHRLWVKADILYQYDEIKPKLDELLDMLASELNQQERGQH